VRALGGKTARGQQDRRSHYRHPEGRARSRRDLMFVFPFSDVCRRSTVLSAGVRTSEALGSFVRRGWSDRVAGRTPRSFRPGARTRTPSPLPPGHMDKASRRTGAIRRVLRRLPIDAGEDSRQTGLSQRLRLKG
jgi:hypothetical protein